MTHFSIKDLAELSGVKQHTIRIWEQRFSFLKPRRASNATRVYTIEELNTLLDVALLNQNGYKISTIDKMNLEEKVIIISSMFHKQRKAINELIIQMAKMDPEEFEGVLDNSIMSWGIHETIQQIVLPFCDKIGLLGTGYTRKFIENILVIKEVIKRKLNFAIERATPAKLSFNYVILFLSTGENNDIPILSLNYLLHMEGYRTIYLGQNVEAENLNIIRKQTRASHIITYISKKHANAQLTAFAESLATTDQKTVFISLENSLEIDNKVNLQYKFASSPAEVIVYLKENSLVNQPFFAQ